MKEGRFVWAIYMSAALLLGFAHSRSHVDALKDELRDDFEDRMQIEVMLHVLHACTVNFSDRFKCWCIFV